MITMTPKFSSLPVAAATVVALIAFAGCGKNEVGVGRPAESAAASQEVDPSDAFVDLVARQASQVLQEHPEMATSFGVSEEFGGVGYNARLGAYGLKAREHARAMNESFLQELKLIDRDALTGTVGTTYDVLEYAYEIAAERNQLKLGGAAIWGLPSPYVISQIAGPHLALPRLLQTQHPVDSRNNVEAYLTRLAEFDRVFDEVRETLDGEAAVGVTPPLFALRGAINSIAKFTAPPSADSPLVTTLIQKMEEVSDLDAAARDDYAARATEVVETVVYPAYARLAVTLEGLTERAGPHAGVWRLGEQGDAHYQLALSFYGGSGMTADDIHELGLAEVARISAEMDAILKVQGFTAGSVAQRAKEIGALPEMLYPNTDAGKEVLIADLNAQIVAVMNKAPEWFGVIPKTPVEVRRVPIYEQDSSVGGFYTGPSLDGTRPGIFWITLKDTADWPKHTLKTLTYHEAVPGHHFQISLQREADDTPFIRNMLGFSEFSEGWGLYVEQLAVEMGMYEGDPLGDLGRLQGELYRAARLVVDTGLHAKRWTLREATDYMILTTSKTPAASAREVERYAVWPGQACSYKLGMIRMIKLRKEAEAALQERFDIREFHNQVLLGGTMPLPVFEQHIKQWIASRKASSTDG